MMAAKMMMLDQCVLLCVCVGFVKDEKRKRSKLMNASYYPYPENDNKKFFNAKFALHTSINIRAQHMTIKRGSIFECAGIPFFLLMDFVLFVLSTL